MLLFVACLFVACAESGEPATTGDAGPTGSTIKSEPTTSDPVTTTTLPMITASVPSAFPARRSVIDPGWESIEIPASAAGRCHSALIGTDTELIVWGGNRASCEYESPVGDSGLAYHPATGMWRRLPESPLGPIVAPTGVWTGSEVIICCGIQSIAPVGGAEIGSSQTAAFDPTTDSWRSLPDAPLGGPFPASLWTGREMIVVTQHAVAGYNPSEDTWRTFSSPPEEVGRVNNVVWTGTEVLAWPVWPTGEVQRRVMQGQALDPETDTWRTLPDPPAWPAALDMVATEDWLVIWGGLPANSGGSERAVGSRYDFDTGIWTGLPEALPEPNACECNLGSQTLTWTGEYILVSPGWFSSGFDPNKPLLIAYHPETDTWILVDDESPLAWGGNSLHVGDRLVMGAGDALYLSPPNWQPTGDAITPNTWDD